MTTDTPRVPQWTDDDLRGKSDDEINEAMERGELAEVLGGSAPIATATLIAKAASGERPVTDADLKRLDPTTICELHSRGLLDHLLRSPS